jgi:hypothetical protein
MEHVSDGVTRFHPGPEHKRDIWTPSTRKTRRSNFYDSSLSCGAAFGAITVSLIRFQKRGKIREKDFLPVEPLSGRSFRFRLSENHSFFLSVRRFASLRFRPINMAHHIFQLETELQNIPEAAPKAPRSLSPSPKSWPVSVHLRYREPASIPSKRESRQLSRSPMLPMPNMLYQSPD